MYKKLAKLIILYTLLSECQPPIFIINEYLYNKFVDDRLRKLLFDKYLEFQKQSEKKVTEKEFAQYIGIGQVFLNQIMNGRRSAGANTIAHLADFFHDMKFYDAVDLPRPDPLLRYTTRHWGEVPANVRRQIAEEIAKYTIEKTPDDDR